MVQTLASASNTDVSDILVLNQRAVTVNGKNCLQVNILALGSTRKFHDNRKCSLF